jgi:hypothetical protein
MEVVSAIVGIGIFIGVGYLTLRWYWSDNTGLNSEFR